MARSLSRLGHRGMLPDAVQRVAENQQRAKMRVEERLDAELVPRAKQAFLPRVPDGKGKIADQMFDAGIAPGVIRVENQLSVRRCRRQCARCAALGFQLRNQLGAGIDSRIGDDPQAAIELRRLLLQAVRRSGFAAECAQALRDHHTRLLARPDHGKKGIGLNAATIEYRRERHPDSQFQQIRSPRHPRRWFVHCVLRQKKLRGLVHLCRSTISRSHFFHSADGKGGRESQLIISCESEVHRLRKSSKRCHSERSEESLFVSSLYLDRREILRFAQNDRTRHFFRSLFRRAR